MMVTKGPLKQRKGMVAKPGWWETQGGELESEAVRLWGGAPQGCRQEKDTGDGQLGPRAPECRAEQSRAVLHRARVEDKASSGFQPGCSVAFGSVAGLFLGGGGC